MFLESRTLAEASVIRTSTQASSAPPLNELLNHPVSRTGATATTQSIAARLSG